MVLSAHEHEALVRDGRDGEVRLVHLGPDRPSFKGSLGGGGPLELQIPTASYRMGVPRPALALLTARFRRKTEVRGAGPGRD